METFIFILSTANHYCFTESKYNLKLKHLNPKVVILPGYAQRYQLNQAHSIGWYCKSVIQLYYRWTEISGAEQLIDP